jgi:putative glycosyltransferase (TIGR04372 family)
MTNFYMSNQSILVLVARKLPPFVKHSIHYLVERKFRRYHNLIKIPKLYFKWLAPNLAVYVYWISLPVFYFFKRKGYLFLTNNITNSPGHVMPELDYFFRRTWGLSDSQNKYIIIWPRSEISHGAKTAYEKHVFKFIVSDLVYILTHPFLIRFPELTIDCGISIVDRSRSRCINYGLNYLPILKEGRREFEENWKILYQYYKLRREQHEYSPMNVALQIDQKLLNFIENSKKYVLIQIKDIVGNGTAKPIDPYSYLGSIVFLKDSGYKIIFAGREKMPALFKDFDVINYSEWQFSSFLYDLQLVHNAELVISSASGFSYLADTMQIPLVYTNQWNFVCPPAGMYTVIVPTLFMQNQNSPWKFTNQINYFYNRKDSNTAIPESLNPRNASSEEILEGAKEALELKRQYKGMTSLQKDFHLLFPTTPLEMAESRISQFFIEKFKASLYE